MITTTLNKIREHTPCEDGWTDLLKHLGKTKADDDVLKFSTIADSNGIDDAVWCLRSICPEHDKEVRLFAADCAEAVLHVFESERPDDDRPRKAIEAARAYANGEISEGELAAASDAARDARDAAWAAAGDAAWDVRVDRDAAWDAAWAVRAAGDAARDAARGARVAWAARAAAGDARDAARDAGDAQTKMLTERFS